MKALLTAAVFASILPVKANALPYHTNSAGFITMPFDIRGPVSDRKYARQWATYGIWVQRYLPLINDAKTGAHLLTAVNLSPGCIGIVNNADSVSVYAVKYVSGWSLGKRDTLVGTFKPAATTARLKGAVKLWCGAPQGHDGVERITP